MVLVIDDDVDILESMKVILEGNGFNTITASTSKEGLNLFKTKKPTFAGVCLVAGHAKGGCGIPDGSGLNLDPEKPQLFKTKNLTK